MPFTKISVILDDRCKGPTITGSSNLTWPQLNIMQTLYQTRARLNLLMSHRADICVVIYSFTGCLVQSSEENFILKKIQVTLIDFSKLQS